MRYLRIGILFIFILNTFFCAHSSYFGYCHRHCPQDVLGCLELSILAPRKALDLNRASLDLDNKFFQPPQSKLRACSGARAV